MWTYCIAQKTSVGTRHRRAKNRIWCKCEWVCVCVSVLQLCYICSRHRPGTIPSLGGARADVLSVQHKWMYTRCINTHSHTHTQTSPVSQHSTESVLCNRAPMHMHEWIIIYFSLGVELPLRACAHIFTIYTFLIFYCAVCAHCVRDDICVLCGCRALPRQGPASLMNYNCGGITC